MICIKNLYNPRFIRNIISKKHICYFTRQNIKDNQILFEKQRNISESVEQKQDYVNTEKNLNKTEKKDKQPINYTEDTAFNNKNI